MCWLRCEFCLYLFGLSLDARPVCKASYARGVLGLVGARLALSTSWGFRMCRAYYGYFCGCLVALCLQDCLVGRLGALGRICLQLRFAYH